MCNSIVLNLSPTILKLKKCVKKLLKGSHMHYHMFLISIRPKQRYNKVVEKEPDSCNSFLITLRPTSCVKKLLMDVLTYWKMSLIAIRLKRCVKNLLKYIDTNGNIFLINTKPKKCLKVFFYGNLLC